jgi:hypothetical protein
VYRVATAWTIFGGVSDIFILCMIWFIFDDKSAPTIFKDNRENLTYAVLDIIKSHDSARSSINTLRDSQEISIDEVVDYRPHSLRISDKMIAQFFKDEEGPDRDWSEALITGEY